MPKLSTVIYRNLSIYLIFCNDIGRCGVSANETTLHPNNNLKSTQCVAWKTVYTAPGSLLRLNMVELEESIHCDFFPTGTKFGKRIVNASREYNITKYQLITSIRPTITIQAPQVIGNFPKGLHILDLERKTLHITDKLITSENETHGIEGSQINLTFTLNTTLPLSDHTVHLDEDTVKYFFQFNLQIKNASTEDDGIYKCLIVTPWIDIVVSPVRFLYQTDDNLLYGREDIAMNISCETVSRHKQDTLYIKHKGTILSASKSNTVTFTFVPDRSDNFKEYECVRGQVFPLVRVKLLVNYAPDVQVIALDHSLDCFATGFPQTYTFKKWEHQSEDGKHIRFLNGLHNGTLNLKMLKLKYQISGRYICTVSNGIPDVNGSLLQKGFKNYHYTGQSIFASENRKLKEVQLYKPIRLTFLLYSDPIVEGIIMQGVAAGHEKNETIYDYKLSRTDLKYTEFGEKGNIEGYKVSFELKMFSDEYKMYKIWACNGIGEDSFSFQIKPVGEPVFVPENRNIKHGEVGQPLLMTFILYSNPSMENIWSSNTTTWNSQAKTKDVFKISKKTLPYTVFGNKGNISGYEIIFETMNLRSNDFHEYYLWAKNKLGVDFYRFEIVEIDSLKNTGNDTSRFTTSTCIASVLFIYIVIVHICIRLKQKSVCRRQSITPEEFHYHAYDEIGSVPLQAAVITSLVVDREGQSQPTRIVQRLQTEVILTDINNQIPSTDRHETSSSVFTHEYPGNATHQNLVSAETIDVASALSRGSLEEENISSNDIIQSFQRGRNQGERFLITNEMSTYSTDSEESKTDSLNSASVDTNVGDGYENPYQIIMQEIQDIHQYGSII